MKPELAEQITLEYHKSVYGFALRHCASADDAEDVAQETALHVYRALCAHDDIKDVRQFVWTIAHNTLANYHRNRTRSGIGVSPDTLMELPADENVAEQVQHRETVHLLQREIAYLSALQRRIVIAYYYEDRTQQAIANTLGLPLGTVKWHLFEARRELKKGLNTMRQPGELKFHPIHFERMGQSGRLGTMGDMKTFFRSTLSQNITYCVWKQPRTVHEIADELGVSPVYVESEAEFLADYGYLLRCGERYLANVVIDEMTTERGRRLDEVYAAAARLVAEELLDRLVISGSLYLPGLYLPGNHLPDDDNAALWSLLPYILAKSGESLTDTAVTFEQAATQRPDGAQNIAYASVIAEDTIFPPHNTSEQLWIGPCWNTTDRLSLWEIDSEWSGVRLDINQNQTNAARKLALLTRWLDGDLLSPDEIAFLIEHGLLRRQGDSFSLACVYIADAETEQTLLRLGDEVKAAHYDQLRALFSPMFRELLAETPPQVRIAQQFSLQFVHRTDGRFLIYCLYDLLEAGRLQLPTEEQKRSLMTVLTAISK